MVRPQIMQPQISLIALILELQKDTRDVATIFTDEHDFLFLPEGGVGFGAGMVGGVKWCVWSSCDRV